MALQQIPQWFATVREIDQMLIVNPNNWQNHLNDARNILNDIESSGFINETARTTDQIWVINIIQRLAFSEPDTGSPRDIAEWCLRQWLSILHTRPQNVPALKGIGQNWLMKAQPALSRIHVYDGTSSSSSGGNGAVPVTANPNLDDEQLNGQSTGTTEAELRLHTSDYVEARGILLPATDFLSQAVTAAESQGCITGDLLATAAEAYMSLGNVSYARTNEAYFRQALRYLRSTGRVPGYELPSHLQRYLDDYGRLFP